MKAISSALATYLAARPTQLIAPDCFTLTLAGGSQSFYTNADVPVTVYPDGGSGIDPDAGVLALGVPGSLVLAAAADVSPTVFLANSIRISGLKYKLAIGLDADEQEITIAAKESETLLGLPFLQALADGVLDGAYLTRDRAYLSAWNSPAIGSVTLFHGRISTLTRIGRTEAQLKVKSDLVLLDADMPRNLYQPSCWYTLYGFGCGLNKSSYAVSGTVGAGSTASSILWSNGEPGAYFNQGTVTFTSGALENVSATVSYSYSGGIVLVAPLTEAPAAGDSFLAYPGCDHTTGSSGCAKFSNLANYPAFPYVPPPTTAL